MQILFPILAFGASNLYIVTFVRENFMTATFAKSAEGMDVKYVAHLARLYLTEAEIEKFQGQLGHILDYVRDLSALNVDGVEPTAHAMPVQNVFREDVVKSSLDRDQVLANAPMARHEQFVVPKIVE